MADERKPMLKDHPNRVSTSGGGDLEDDYLALLSLLEWHKSAFEANNKEDYKIVMVKGKPNTTSPNQMSQFWDMFRNVDRCADEAIDDWTQNKEYWRHSCRQKHLEGLNHFWSSDALTIRGLEDMMFTLGPNITRLINAMCLKLPAKIMQTRKLQKRTLGGALSIRIEHVGNFKDKWDEGMLALNAAANKIAPSNLYADSNVLGRLLGHDVKEKVEVYMCGHKFYDTLGHSTDNESLLEVSLLLVAAPGVGSNIELLQTPFGQSVAAVCWELSFPQYVWQRTMDFLNLCFLCWYATPICHSTHSDQPRWMEKWKVLLVFYFSMRGVFNILIELVSMLLFSGYHQKGDPEHRSFTLSLFFVAYVNIFTFISLAVEILTSSFGLKLVRDFYKPPGAPVNDFLGNVQEFFGGLFDPCDYSVDLVKEHIVNTTMYARPVSFAMIIFSKWCIFMMTLLNFDKLSKTALPAWHAIRSSESIWFLVYLMMLTFGCMLAYYSLPVPDIGGNPEEQGMNGWALAFTRIFRLTLMGDFDMWALEGVDDRIQLPADLRNASIDIVNGPTVKEMHKALRFWVLILALVFPVVLLNVYVGIIGKVYEDAKNSNIAITSGFRIVSSFRLLLHRRFWKRCCCGAFTLDTLARCFQPDLTKITEAEMKSNNNDCYAAFIRVPRDRLPAQPQNEQTQS